MRFFLYENQQVACHTIVFAGISFATHRKLHTLCHSGRDFHRYHFFTVNDSVATTFLTFVLDNLTLTATSRTSDASLHSAQNSLLVTDHGAATLTSRTSLRTAVTFGTRAMTLVTRHIFFEFKFLFYSGRDLLQRQLHFHTKVTAAIPALL